MTDNTIDRIRAALRPVDVSRRYLGTTALEEAAHERPLDELVNNTLEKIAELVSLECYDADEAKRLPQIIRSLKLNTTGEALRPLGASGDVVTRSLTSAPLPPAPEDLRGAVDQISGEVVGVGK